MAGRFLSELKRRNVIRVAGVYVVTAWALFQIAKTIFETLSFPKWAAPLALVLLALGLPIAIVIAWAFERAPDGSVTRTKTPEDAPKARLNWSDWALVAVMGGMLVVSLGQVAGVLPGGMDRARPTNARMLEKSVAVLPFANFSAQKETEYFADGLTEEVINSLTQVPDLKVAGRTSAFYFKGRNEDLREVGRKLGVAHVVEGSVRREGERLRITAQLISVDDGFHLWSKTYDRKMDDAFAIQTEIAGAVTEALKIRLKEGGPPPSGSPRDPAAYQLELTARAHLRRMGLEELRTAREQFERLTTLEPNNASALAGYAQATMLLAQSHLALDFSEAQRVSEAALDKALKIDPKNVDAWLARAAMDRILAIRQGSARHDRDRLVSLRRALALDPRNPMGLTLYATYLSEHGSHPQAVEAARKALKLDPLDRVSQMVLADALRAMGRLNEAGEQYRSVLQLYPDFNDAKFNLGELLMEQGRLDEAEPWLRAVVDTGTDPGAAIQLASLYNNLGLLDEAVKTLGLPATSPAAEFMHVASLAAQGRYADGVPYSLSQRGKDDDSFWSQAIVVCATMSGDDVLALRTMRSAEPELFLPEPGIAVTDLSMPLFGAHLLNKVGERAQARRIAENVLANTRPSADGYLRGQLRLMRLKAFAEIGETDKALNELELAVKAGWRMPFDTEDYIWIDQHPNAESLRANPKFRALLAQVRQDLARQKASLLASRR
ncbi:tetratricopeptide repeat protein [Phenylobacterium sp.]|uniref:tetratricopeptide repeat protein n=1 Tax=Phenylobacterium sp. TaxID=1871053 RepID=UPI002735A94C|nr:tetratricopeptide repeat protein [Phenylobacterium sp.]MDP3660105.1 tetratricopeptide repeat protein [Phenylobacterium sp.]